jgi:hypothetical protein
VDIPTDVEIIDIDADPESPPRNPSPLPGPTLPVPSSVPDDVDELDSDSPANDAIVVVYNHHVTDAQTVATDDADDEQIEIEIHELGLQFVQQYVCPPVLPTSHLRLILRRYILTFDSERPALARAYTDDAVFSFRDTDLAAPAHFTFQRAARLAQAGSASFAHLYCGFLLTSVSQRARCPRSRGCTTTASPRAARPLT